MKAKILLAIYLMLHMCIANAENRLNIVHPQEPWLCSYQGSIDTAVLSIKPKGAYFECGLYLTFSSGPYSCSDSTEIQLRFELPKGSFVHDSWLWVGNQIVRADLLDRNRASMIYEGIVQRRQDPSLLVKDSETQYELRVYPLPPNQKRKVKITYLVPADWTSNLVSVPVPLNILKTSANTPYFEVLSYKDSVWQNPRIAELPSMVFSPSGNNPFEETAIPGPFIQNLETMTYVMNSPMKNGVYAAGFEASPGNGYYQLVVLPGKALNIQAKRKCAVLLDFDQSQTTVTSSELLARTKLMLLNYMTPQDSFNLFYAKLSVVKASNTWLPCDSQIIENIFNAISPSSISPYSSLPALLGEGVNFVKQAGPAGELVLLSSSTDMSSVTLANQLIADVQSAMAPHVYPIHVVDFANINVSYVWMVNKYYYGNDYFNGNIAALTGGNYERCYIYDPEYWYNTSSRPFAQATTALFEKLGGSITNFELYPQSNSGFCFAKYNSSTGNKVPINKAYIQMGRYSGSAPSSADITGNFGLYSAIPLQHAVNLTEFQNSDSLTRKMWMSGFLDALQFDNPDNMTKAELIDSSRLRRVLSRFTAFLALEPSDTTSACSDCEDETNSGTTAIATLEDSVRISAFPNPFSGSVKINLNIQADLKDASLVVYDLMGREVKVLTLNTMKREQEIVWNGEGDNGENVVSGVYLLSFKSAAYSKVIRLIKQ